MTPPSRPSGPATPGDRPRRPPGRDGRGRSSTGMVRIGDALGAVASHLGAGRAEVVGVVFGQWDDIVGPAVAAHVRPVRVDGVTLVVSADHSAWAKQMRHLAPNILGRIRDVCGAQHTIERLDVRVRR
jgi:predicted nucleic acid-binding Zn ribbon protein